MKTSKRCVTVEFIASGPFDLHAVLSSVPKINQIACIRHDGVDIMIQVTESDSAPSLMGRNETQLQDDIQESVDTRTYDRMRRERATQGNMDSYEDTLERIIDAAGFIRSPGEDDESFYGRLLQGIREQRAEYIVSTNVKKTKIGALAFEMWWSDRPKVVSG